MKIAFLKGTGIVDRLIQMWTFSKYSHCEMIFSNEESFGNSLIYPFKTCISRKPYLPKYWDIIDVNISAEKESKIRDFCEKNIGKSYDWTAIFFSMIIPFRLGSKDKFICSEVCTEAFQAAGYFSDKKACTVSPGKFYKLIQSIK
jgi:uncharacterized protein YycO